MIPGWAVLAGVGLAAGALVGLLWRSQRETRRLRERLESASANLERLQRVFGRFAPHEVVEQVIESGVTTRGERREVTACSRTWSATRPSPRRSTPRCWCAS